MFVVVVLFIVEFQLYYVLVVIFELFFVIVFGGLLLGVGVGMVICYGGVLDGIEILGILLIKKILFFVGEFVMFLNIFIFV